MWEAVIAVCILTRLAFGLKSVVVRTGLPSAFGFIGLLWHLQLLPPSLYEFTAVPVSTLAIEFVLLVALTDGLQYASHRVMHQMRVASHAVHHSRKYPAVHDAFYTGYADAVLQLLVPLVASLWIVRPSRLSTDGFGVFYGLWLQWIHSDESAALAQTSRYLVTPSHHRLHHINPRVNFGHVLRAWDQLGGTDMDVHKREGSTGGSQTMTIQRPTEDASPMPHVRHRGTRAATRILAAWAARRRRRMDAIDTIGGELQQDFRCLQNAFLIDADEPGDFARLESRYMAYVSIAKKIGCPARSLDAREEYIID